MTHIHRNNVLGKNSLYFLPSVLCRNHQPILAFRARKSWFNWSCAVSKSLPTGLCSQKMGHQPSFTEEASTRNTNTLKKSLIEIKIKILCIGSKKVHRIHKTMKQWSRMSQEFAEVKAGAERRLEAVSREVNWRRGDGWRAKAEWTVGKISDWQKYQYRGWSRMRGRQRRVLGKELRLLGHHCCLAPA